MRRYRSRDGEERIWYTDREIEEIMRVELEKAELLPSPESPSVDIEGFVEFHLQVGFDRTADLAPDELGVTEFLRGGAPIIKINRDLTGSALDEDDSPLGIRGRWRATVAHEASHVILHKVLFDEGPAQQGTFLFAEEAKPEAPRVFRSLKRDVSFVGCASGDWREVQANKGMAALLMPKPVFLEVCQRELEQSPLPSLPNIGPDHPELRSLIGRLAQHFEVSRQATSIRLETLGVLNLLGQPRLL
jgi:hypothetical protein